MTEAVLPSFIGESALTIAAIALGTSVLVWSAWLWLRRLEFRRMVGPAATAHRIQIDSISDLLLVCTEADKGHLFQRWMSTEETLVRIATTAEETVERLINRRPDIVWLILDQDRASMLALAQKLRGMQADAFELPSWIVALTSGELSRHRAHETRIFDQVLPEPLSQNACMEAFRQTIANMPRSHRGPWIQRATENAMPGFLASRQALAQSIVQAVREGRNADAAKSAHTLAGSPGMHNFDRGIAACRYIEQHHATTGFAELLHRADEIRDLIDQIELR